MSGATVTRVVKYIRKGEDAVNISVEPSTVIFTEVGQRLEVAVRVTKGTQDVLCFNNNNEEYVFHCGLLSPAMQPICDGKISWSFNISPDRKTFWYRLMLRKKAKINHVVPFTVVCAGVTYNREIHISSVFDGDKGDKGAVLRGPQAWSDLPIGYHFQSGAQGEDFLDVTIYNGSFYSCSKSHVKTADNFPYGNVSNNQGLWKLGDKFDMVATKILLAQYALVKNLGVETIEMKDAFGNVVFSAKDGNVICKRGSFENVVLSGHIYKKKFILTRYNLSRYSFINDFDDRELNFDSIGSSWIEFKELRSDVTIHLKGIQPNTAYNTAEKKDKIRSMIGTKLLLQNRSNYTILLVGEIDWDPDDIRINFGSSAIAPNKVLLLECKCGNKDGWETVYWQAFRPANISPNRRA
ncbi:MAG: hypothetical protein ACTTKJ_01095 [Prevotella koreensis]|uniref:hypothetical protein n=1 Tax=Prevotella koreensis TaxID=2490854 RepID=UPI003FA0BB2D